jgi:peptidoglycan/LPS O-acetylase OafA/YrhL
LARQANPRIPELDSTRGLAALLVFLGHAFFFIRPSFSDGYILRGVSGLLWRFLDGSAAVDYFFVLSGFVLALPFLGDSESSKALSFFEFILRRVVRIMPTYWAALFVAFSLRSVCNWLDIDSSDPALALMNWGRLVSLDDVFSHLLLIWKDPNSNLVNGPIWSLSVEMKISLLLPLFIAALRHSRTPRDDLAIFVLSLYLGGRDHGSFTWLPLFVLGVGLAKYRDPLVHKVRDLHPFVTPLLFVIACVLFWNRELQSVWSFPSVGQEWLSGIGAMLFLLVILSHRFWYSSLKNPAFHFLGKISYSFYLVHLPVLQASILVLRSRGVNDWIAMPVAILAVLVSAVILYYVVELPSLHWGRYVSRGKTLSHAAPL